MRKPYLLICLALFPLASLAQGKIVYSYDAAGNRVKREMAAPVSKAMARQRTLIDISSQPTGVYLLRITINDNPTTWKITKK